MSRVEREVRSLLKQHATLSRINAGHEIWKIPGAPRPFVLHVGKMHERAFKNAKSELRHLLAKVGIKI